MNKVNKSKRVTIGDIAKETGYSIATVSRVVNKTHTFYSEQTRQKIEDAVHRLGYKPDIMARGLKERRSYGIALITPQIDEFYTGMYNRMNQLAMQAGYSLILLSSQNDPQMEARHIGWILDRNFDGVVVATGFLGNEEKALKALSNLPVVMAEASSPRSGVSCVYVETGELCRQATRHLLENGHRRVAYVSAPLQFDTLRDRFRGYRQALFDYGIPQEDKLVYFSAELVKTSYEGSFRLMQQILKERDFSAMFVISDWAAFTAIKAAKEMNLAVPGDLSIVGFDNLPFTDFSEPPLTTVSQDQDLIGEAAMRLVLERIKGMPARTVQLEGKVVFRNSVAPPA